VEPCFPYSEAGEGTAAEQGTKALSSPCADYYKGSDSKSGFSQ